MIDFDKYWSLLTHFLASNLLITAGIILALVIFFYKKPEQTIKFVGFCALLVTVVYIMSLLSESGSTGALNKNVLKSKSESSLME